MWGNQGTATTLMPPIASVFQKGSVKAAEKYVTISIEGINKEAVVSSLLSWLQTLGKVSSEAVRLTLLGYKQQFPFFPSTRRLILFESLSGHEHAQLGILLPFCLRFETMFLRTGNIFSHLGFDLQPPTIVSHRLCSVRKRRDNKLLCCFTFSHMQPDCKSC